MKEYVLAALPPLLKVLIPSFLGGLGALAAAGWSDWFRAFCGL